MERLQKIIAKAGITSRRKAEDLITEGKVKVNGEIVTELGTRASFSDEIIVDGKKIHRENLVYFVLYKPEGYISAVKDQFNRKTVVDLIPVKEKIFPVGRLDYDTSGLILITNDGDFAQHMIHPKYMIEKEYYVRIKGLLRKESSILLAKGLKYDGIQAMPAKVWNVNYDEKKETTFLNIIITEGKNHQVKKMFEALGHEVIKLKRERFGTVTLEGLNKGEYRILKPHEIKTLYNLSKNG
ncbi:MAG: rRNA pseudouridine synthase [Candidatus Izimaplasma sp.]|nr:rRNA pseudouridine synthase [Candidatus Izimaplasma bacterium]